MLLSAGLFEIILSESSNINFHQFLRWQREPVTDYPQVFLHLLFKSQTGFSGKHFFS